MLILFIARYFRALFLCAVFIVLFALFLCVQRLVVLVLVFTPPAMSQIAPLPFSHLVDRKG